MFNNPGQAGDIEVQNPSARGAARPHTVAADDYGWDAKRSSKLNLAQLSLQGADDNITSSDDHIERNQTSIIDTNDPNDSYRERHDGINYISGVRDRAKEKRQARRKHKMQKKIQQDAAKTAAEYYGECHIEGVGIIAADKAAKESHRRYKKWWQGQHHFDEFNLTSLGDGLHVPRYNPRKPRAPVHISHGPNDNCDHDESFNHEQANPKSHEIGGKAHAVAAAITSSVILPNSSCDVIDRFSGTRHPPPVDTTIMDPRSIAPLNQRVGAERMEQSKKRQRPMSDSKMPPQSCVNNSKAVPATDNFIHHSTFLADCDPRKTRFSSFSKPAAVVSEPEGADYDEAFVASRTDFENEKITRREVQRRGSSYSDYEDGEPLRSRSQQRRRPSDFYHEEVSRYRSSSNATDSLMKDAYYHADDEETYDAIMTSINPPLERTAKHIDNAKLDVIRSLAISGGDVTSKPFLFALEQLRTLYVMTGFDARKSDSRLSPTHLEGNWFTLSRPNYTECIGTNTAGEYMYTLGRMSFDMFTPSNLVCSIGGIFNAIEIVEDGENLRSIPKSLKDDVTKSDCVLRRYDIITAFKVEGSSPSFGPNSPNSNVHHPLRGTITTYGYILPDPETPNRLSIWFSGGKIEANVEGKELEQWKSAFREGGHRRPLYEKARVLAAKLLLGAIVPSQIEDDGHMEFQLTRPIGGHGSTYIDVLYMDENLRIVQGQKGSLFVFTRVSSSP